MLTCTSIHSTLTRQVAFFSDGSSRQPKVAQRGDLINGFEVEEIYSPLNPYNGYLVVKDKDGHEFTVSIGDDLDHLSDIS